MTCVFGPRCAITSLSEPTAMKRPSLIAAAEAVERLASWVAILAFIKIKSASCWFPAGVVIGILLGEIPMNKPYRPYRPYRAYLLFTRGGGRWDHIFRVFCRRRVVHHRIGVFHALAVSAEVVFDDVHDRVVSVFQSPVAL